MPDLTQTLTVLLDQEYRDEDVKLIKNAILMVKGVSAVEHIVCDPREWSIRETVYSEMRAVLLDALRKFQK